MTEVKIRRMEVRLNNGLPRGREVNDVIGRKLSSGGVKESANDRAWDCLS